MKNLIIPRSSLDGAVNDPLTRLVELFGDKNGHRLFGAAVGDAPGGFLTRDDVLETVPGQSGLTVDGQPVNEIWANMQAMLAAFNASNDQIVSLLSFETDVANEKIGVPINPGFQKATEFGRPSKIRMAMIARGFPYEHFDLGDGYTQEYIDLATGAQLLAVQATILNAWTTLEREVVMEAVYGPANYTDQDGINVKRLYNADGEVPPQIKRWTHDGTHTHYLFNGTGTGFVQGDLDTMGEHLVHHGFREFGDATFILFVNRADLPGVKAFANFIPAEGAEQPQNLAASGIIRGLQRTGGTSGLQVEGYCNDWTIVQANDFPAGYLFGMVSGGPMDLRNVVGKRVHPNPSVRGLRLIEGPRQNYPLYDSVYDGYFGAGVAQRGAAVIMQDHASAYSSPTFNTGE